MRVALAITFSSALLVPLVASAQDKNALDAAKVRIAQLEERASGLEDENRALQLQAETAQLQLERANRLLAEKTGQVEKLQDALNRTVLQLEQTRERLAQLEEKVEAGRGSEGEPDVVNLPSGLQYQDLKSGEGDRAEDGSYVSVHYVGTLESGKEFDNSLRRGAPIRFRLGARRVIRGWEEGIRGMKVGGRRRLVIPPELGYGAQGAGELIPPHATLVFEVELVAVQ